MQVKQFFSVCLLCCGVVAALTACSSKPSSTASTEPAATNRQPEQVTIQTLVEGIDEGNKYIDIKLPGMQGNIVKVSDYVSKNKFTLVDFWASWCAPCRGEMPYVAKVYNDYHSKGFEVIGVSLDNDKAAWMKAVEDLKMPWPQMSDLKGWSCEGALIYKIHAIPANVLIDQQGQIVTKNLRGEQLLKVMETLMK